MEAKVYNPQVSFYNNLFGKERANVPVLKILQAIKSGRWRSQIERIRAEGDKHRRNELKKGLPCFTASGVFTVRESRGLVEHSGLLQVDIDNVGSKSDVEYLKYLVSDLVYVYACFVSPSGNGIKALVRIPAKAETHLYSFNAVKQLFRDLYGVEIDHTKDLPRLFYVSYDPDEHINPQAKVFPFFKKEDRKVSTSQKKTIFQN